MTFIFTIAGFLVMGYHPGIEDDGVYLAAIKYDLRPSLFPHDSAFFRLQLQATLFDRAMAAFVRLTHIPVAWAELIVQFGSLFLILWAAHSIAQQLFKTRRAQWAGVALLSAMFTLPVAGTALYIADQHLHPRNLATALILLAANALLRNRKRTAVVLLIAAFVTHPIMGAMGMSFCFFLNFLGSGAPLKPVGGTRGSMAAATPLAWIFEPTSASWRQALATRRYYFIFRWTWYEWTGALAPLLLFWFLWKWARRAGRQPLAGFSLAVLAYGLFQQGVALALLTPPTFARLMPLQPMRYLQLVYVFMVLLGGCLVGEYVLGRHAYRWVVYLLAINAGMMVPQRVMFAATEPVELPGVPSRNPWLQAFAWIRENTPEDAYFTVDPNYMALPGEDYHSFRALAERSQMVDALKDTAVVTQVPQLGSEWQRQLRAQAEFDRFTLADFERLKAGFGVDWTLVRLPAAPGLDCRWHNAELAVCRIP